MKEIDIAFPLMDLRSLVDDRQQSLSFTTNEHGEPIRVTVRVREHLPRAKGAGPPVRRRMP